MKKLAGSNRKSLIVLLTLSLFNGCKDNKEEAITIAVASNFEKPIHRLKEEFLRRNPQHSSIKLVIASSGVLATQIINQAPFDLFLAADDQFPSMIRKQLSLKNSPKTYAFGKLALVMPKSKYKSNCLKHIEQPNTLVIANPETAPYGKLAKNILKNSKLKLKKLITANNVNQAYLYVMNQHVDAGFVPYSFIAQDNFTQGCIQVFENPLLEQQAILINTSAKDFNEFLFSELSQNLIHEFGYSKVKSTHE